MVTSTDRPIRSGLSVGSGLVEHDLDRDALHNLDPVAGGVFRWQEGEGRAGADAD